jgi:hypothetical protein
MGQLAGGWSIATTGREIRLFRNRKSTGHKLLANFCHSHILEGFALDL